MQTSNSAGHIFNSRRVLNEYLVPENNFWLVHVVVLPLRRSCSLRASPWHDFTLACPRVRCPQRLGNVNSIDKYSLLLGGCIYLISEKIIAHLKECSSSISDSKFHQADKTA
jgi:hypothetical protein